MKTKTYLFILMAMISVLSLQATSRYVKISGSDSNDGISWATAKLTVTAALTASVSGDVIYVAQGTYETTTGFNMKNGVNVYGGYDDATGLRDIVNYETILRKTGTADARVLNSAVMTIETIFDGFTITGGNRSTGGSGASLNTLCTLSNCKITGNGGVLAGSGGGVLMTNTSKLLNCIVENNTSGGSAAVFSSSSTDQVVIENCIIRNNKAASVGGVSLRGSSVMKNCIIANNEATTNNIGGLSLREASKVFNCTIVNNKTILSSSTAGGIYMIDQSTIQNCIVWNNNSQEPVINRGGTATMITCAVQSSPAAGSFLLNATNTEVDGPNFVAPSTTIGNTTEDQSSINWHLVEGSPCINTGTDLTSLGVSADILGVSRPAGSGFDIGAYEEAITGVLDIKKSDVLTIYPSPSNNVVKINMGNISSVNVFDMTGAAVPVNYYNSQVDISSLAKGIYTFVIKANNKNYVARAIKN